MIVPNQLSDRVIAIVGFMGCGKTSVARLLAARLSCAMIDLDELISERTQRTPAQIILEDGEAAFRAIETKILSELLSDDTVRVISVGGGAWVEEINRRLLSENGVLTAWIDVPFEVCWRRLQSAKEIRPLAPTKNQARSLFEKRRPIYALADIHVAARAGETPKLLVDRLSQALTGSV